MVTRMGWEAIEEEWFIEIIILVSFSAGLRTSNEDAVRSQTRCLQSRYAKHD